ncbi:hypothetical protein [Massilia timonae]|uniref:hypothetical protein n=1 Tax=Massilia timonae TaxID=47229 RepID=UPI0028A70CC8|nr:hypothetical protein [Massilia timonae]
MARNNFSYEKRQRELEKKRKAEEKAKRKLEAKNAPADGAGAVQPDGAANGEEGEQRTPAAAPPSLA